MGMSLSKLWEFVMDREAWLAAIHEVAKNQTRLTDWTELNWTELNICALLKSLTDVEDWFSLILLEGNGFMLLLLPRGQKHASDAA